MKSHTRQRFGHTTQRSVASQSETLHVCFPLVREKLFIRTVTNHETITIFKITPFVKVLTSISFSIRLFAFLACSSASMARITACSAASDVMFTITSAFSTSSRVCNALANDNNRDVGVKQLQYYPSTTRMRER